MPDRRLIGTKVDANGRRVPADQFEEAESAAARPGYSVPEGTQIAADGARVAVDDRDPAEPAPVQTGEAAVRAERAAHVAGASNPPANGTGISNDVETTGSADASDDDGADESDVDDMTKAQLLDVARDLEIEGTSTMNKDELLAAVKDAQG